MVVRSDWDVEEEEQVAEPSSTLLSTLLKGHEIHRPPPGAAISPPPNIPWSMVAVRNCKNHNYSDPLVIFPPINHENLQISSDPSLIPKQIAQIHKTNNGPVKSPPKNQLHSYSDSNSDSDSDSITNSNSSSTLSLSDSSRAVHCPLFSSPRTRAATTWFDAWTEILHSNVNGIVRFLWGKFASSRGMFSTFRSAAIVAMLLVYLYLRQRRRLRVDEVSRARLVSIIKEKDEKINQLLDQISRMNQVLLAHYRVSSSGSTT